MRMPSLKEVVEQFKNSFQYLDSEGHRKVRWYEFWFADFTKERFTNTNLTKEIEQAAQECTKQLNALSAQRGEEPFESHEEAFFKIIITAIRTVQVQRFKSGTLKTENYQHDQHYIMERTLHPKKEGVFESMLINGLSSVKKTFPVLSPVMEQKISRIIEAKAEPILLLHESMHSDQNGNNFFSVDGKPRTMEDVEHTITEKLKCI